MSNINTDNTAVVLEPGTYNPTLTYDGALSREYGLFCGGNYGYDIIGEDPGKTIINLTFSQNYEYVISLHGGKINLYDIVFNIDNEYNSPNTWENCIISDGFLSGGVFNSYNCVYKYIGKDYRRGVYYSNVSASINFNNSIIDMGSGVNSYTGHNACNNTAIFNNTIFNNMNNWFSSYSYSYSPYLSLKNCILSNSGNNFYNITTSNCITQNLILDSSYNITNTDAWKNSGIGTNPDGTQANIGVYGGAYAWGLVAQTPVNLTASAGDAQASLSWDAVTDATGYNIKRATTSGGPYTTVSSVSSAVYNYTDTALTNGTTYYYVVTATNSGGESGNSNEVFVTPQQSLPNAPANLAATPGDAQVSLSWNIISDATSYNVKRATTAGGPYTTIASPTSQTYIDTGLANGTAYYYVVTAVNAGGESSNSNEVSSTPEQAVQTPGVPSSLFLASKKYT